MNDHSYRNMNQWMFRGMLVYVLLSFLTPILMYQFRDNNRLIVIDGRNTYHITKYASQEQLVQLYEYTARLATDAFLMRNPNGLDRAELFDEQHLRSVPGRRQSRRDAGGTAAEHHHIRIRQHREIQFSDHVSHLDCSVDSVCVEYM